MQFRYTCVNCPNLEELEYMLEHHREITIDTFKKKIGADNFQALEESLGYGKHLRMKDDWHVSFGSGKLSNGQSFTFLQHSAIEYVYY